MTKLQQEFYKLIRQKVIEFNEDFHEEMTIARIEKIPDEELKYLLDEIYSDKDLIAPKKHKGYITYAKFIYYTDKRLQQQSNQLVEHKNSYAMKLYQKREMLLESILSQLDSIEQKNKLIEDFKAKKTIFEIDGQNIFNECDYYIIEQFGVYNFFDSNKNYMVKEEFEKYFTNYTLACNLDSQKLLNM